MATLSDNDIRQELGLNILIYPFHEGNLKGTSYNLTASKLAWELSTKKSIYDLNSNKIIIPEGKTALIETHETIWVSKKISGTYHSRVTQVSQGTGHIGTTLDPNYIGASLIAVHNHSNQPVELIPEVIPFVTLAFQYVHTESSREQHGNSHGRRDILGEVGIQLSTEESNALDQPYMSNKELLRSKLEECIDYQSIKSERETKANQIKTEHEKKTKEILSNRLYQILFGVIIVLMLLSWNLESKQQQLGKQTWYAPTTSIINTARNAVLTVLTALIAVSIQRKI